MTVPLSALQLSFNAGLDESQRPEVLPPGSWVTLENIRFDQVGGATKRYGFTYQTLTRLQESISDQPTTRSAGYRLLPLGEGIGVIGDGLSLETYSSTLDRYIDNSRVPEATYELDAAPTLAMPTAYLLDVAYCNGYVALLQQYSTGLYCTVLDTDGNVVRKTESVATLGAVEAFACLSVYGTTFMIVIADSSSANITGLYLGTTTAVAIATGWSSTGNLATDKTTSGVGAYKIASAGLSSCIVVGYVNNSGASTQITLLLVDSTGTLDTYDLDTSTTKPTDLALARDGSTFWVAWNEGTAVKLNGIADDFSSEPATTATIVTLNSGTDPNIGICVTASGRGRLAVTDGGQDRAYIRGFTTTAGAATTDGSQYTIPNAMLGSRPVLVGGRCYALFAPAFGSTANAQKLCILCDFTEDQTWLRPVCNVRPSYAKLPALGKAGIWSLGSSRYVTAIRAQQSATGYATELVTFDFADVDRWQHVEHNGEHILGGGCVVAFDGSRAAEVGMLIRHPAVTASDSGGGSGPNGSYRYVITYEERDSRGIWHTSGVSDAMTTAVTVVDNTITVRWHTLGITARQRSTAGLNVRARIWRTLAGGEPPYYYVTERLNTTSTVPTYSTYADSTTDASLASNELLRGDGNLPATNGSAQDRRPPPGLKHLVSYNGCLVGAEGSTLWYSGQAVGGEGVWFSPLFQLPLPSKVTAMATQDGTLYAFTRDAIYAITGEAPSDNGASGGLGTPRRLSVDVGAAQSPTCVTSLGIFFVSRRGIEVLTRSQSVEWIGERVQNTLASYPYVLSITFDPTSSCVLVECAASVSSGLVAEESGGRTLVYDTRTNAWSVDRRTNYTGTADAPAQDACTLWDGSAWRYSWLDPGGRVHIEAHTTHLDPNSAWVTMRADSPKMRPNGLQANHRVLSSVLLADWATNHQTRINVAYDDSSSWTDTQTWSATELAALTRQQLEVECSVPQVMSVQIRIEDLTPSNTTATPITTGDGATWVGLALNIGPNNTRQATTLLAEGHRK